MLVKARPLLTWSTKQVRPSSAFPHEPLLSSAARRAFALNKKLAGLMRRGDLSNARQLFDETPHRSIVSWNVMISGYYKMGRAEDALHLAIDMHRTGGKFSPASFSTLLAACARSSSAFLGKQVHCLILQSGSEVFDVVGCALLNLYSSCFDVDCASLVFEELHGRNALLWSPMVVAFVRCNLRDSALDVFERMPERDVVSWTALISGYSQSSDDDCRKALALFLRMTRDDKVKANEFTYDTVLRACTKMGSLCHGKMIHGSLVRCGFELDRSISSALIQFYCSCEVFDCSMKVYELLDKPCTSISNALIGSLISISRIKDAEMIFNKMPERDPVSYNLMIKGYAQDGRIADSKALFDKMHFRNIVSLNNMMSVYHRNGNFGDALQLFEDVKCEKDTVTWNSMISGYVQNEQPVEAIRLYAIMQQSKIECSRSTFSALFRSCAAVGSLKQGKILHAHLSKTPFESNAYVGTSLVDMYAKCGSIPDARLAFHGIISPNVAAWTALVNGLAQHGHGAEALIEFGRMLKNRIEPNAVTFVGIIIACCTPGLMDKGTRFFNSMNAYYRLLPTVEHYTCMVHLLGRSGSLKEAEKLVADMPVEADSVILGALLNACWLCGDLEAGARVAEKMFALNTEHVSPYVLMSNIYAKLGRWEEVMKVRKRMRALRRKKDPGSSWIEVEHTIHVFSADDRNHPQREDVYRVLRDLAGNFYFCSELDSDVLCDGFEQQGLAPRCLKCPKRVLLPKTPAGFSPSSSSSVITDRKLFVLSSSSKHLIN